MAPKVRTWVWVIVAVVVLGILGIIAMAGAGLYYFSRHIKTEDASPAAALSRFEEVRKRFPDRTPLVELDDGGNFSRSNIPAHPVEGASPPETLQFLAYDARDGRVVQVALPFWLLRLNTGRSAISVNGNDVQLEDLQISIDDLERIGPALVLDHQGTDGDRVLVWTQ